MKKIYMIFLAILTVVALAYNSYILFRDYTGSIFDIVKIEYVIVLLLTVLYAAIGYKKPHGNLMKILMLLFAISMMAKIYSDAMSGWVFLFIIQILCMMCIVYAAGRLDRIDQNKYLLPFILVLLIVSRIALTFSFQSSFDILLCIGSYTSVIIWLDICTAYFLRYKEHKEAGLADAPKK